MKKANVEVDVFFDAQKKDYYIRIKTFRREELPSYEDMTSEEQKQMLCDEYPELVALLRKKKPSYEDIELDIDPKIREYNERTRAMLRIRWKLYYGGIVRQINDDGDALTLDKKVHTFVDLKYDGNADDTAIIKFIQQHQSENGKDVYIAFECASCGNIGYGRMIAGKTKCNRCGQAITLNDQNVSKFAGENALFRAAQSASEKRSRQQNESQTENVNVLPKTRAFYYNKISYGISLPEFKALHEMLYSDCAVEKVFVIEESGNIIFNPAYESYLRILSEKGINSKPYKSRQKILTHINSASNGLCGAMAGFYWYFNEYELTQSSALKWRTDKALYSFKSAQEYITTLCAEDNAVNKENLISLFNEQTCQYFFKGYDFSFIELSHLIFDITNTFIFITDDGKGLQDFGRDFISHLSDFDDKIGGRNEFIEAIRADIPFWDKIKGRMDDMDGYWCESGDGTYYDRLCYYQFAIQGKTIMKYKSLQIKDTEAGIEYIKSIITSAYIRRDGVTQSNFFNLIQMLYKTELFNSMVIGNERFAKVGSIPFIKGLMRVVNVSDRIPTIEAYLFCLNSINKRTKIEYGGKVDTLLNHAYAQINSDSGTGAYLNFVLSDSVSYFIKTLLEDQYDSIKTESENYFNNIISELNQKQKDFNVNLERLAINAVAK